MIETFLLMAFAFMVGITYGLCFSYNHVMEWKERFMTLAEENIILQTELLLAKHKEL
jgi:Mg2+/citrate symporter